MARGHRRMTAATPRRRDKAVGSWPASASVASTTAAFGCRFTGTRRVDGGGGWAWGGRFRRSIRRRDRGTPTKRHRVNRPRFGGARVDAEKPSPRQTRRPIRPRDRPTPTRQCCVNHHRLDAGARVDAEQPSPRHAQCSIRCRGRPATRGGMNHHRLDAGAGSGDEWCRDRCAPVRWRRVACLRFDLARSLAFARCGVEVVFVLWTPCHRDPVPDRRRLGPRQAGEQVGVRVL